MSTRVVAWSDDLSVGVRAFDRDHRALTEQLNEIVVAAESGTSPRVLADLVRNLLVGTEEHFRREEAYLHRIGFPEAESHAGEHRRLLSEIGALKEGTATVDERALAFLRHWLIDHIVDFDKTYAAWEKSA
ncbi:MAG: hemerythrin family protein [Magnetospirillum sp. WYHS-4]